MIKISDTEYFSNDGTIRFLNMDCNKFMKGLNENEFDLNLSDPPYGISYDGAKQTSGAHGGRKAHEFKGWDDNIPLKETFDELFRTSIDQIIWGANYMVEHIRPSMGWIVWRKDRGNFSSSDCELAYTSFNRALREYTKNPLVLAREGGTIHPTQKPICLYRWILQNYTKPTDTILDCFGGSMSNAIACHMERRKLTIIELDADYFKGALKRFDFYERQLTLF